MNTFEILFFGGLKSFFPSSLVVELTNSATGQMLIDTLAAQKPDAQNLLSACIIAVDKKVVARTEPLSPGLPTALLPPFSGG